jgi:fermentation-respiration switch protein FrsA (DUF1100 family)
LTAKLFFNIDIDKVRPIDKIAILSKTPVLFMHGETDTLIPPEHSKILADTIGAQRVTFPNTEHVETYINNKSEYLNIVEKFFEEKLKAD